MVKPDKEDDVAYKIENGKPQFLSFYEWDEKYFNLDADFTDNPKEAKALLVKFDYEAVEELNLTVVTLEEAISLMPGDFFTHRENVTKQAAIPFAESIIKLLQQGTPTKSNDRLMYNAHLQACSNQLLELINEFANDY